MSNKDAEIKYLTYHKQYPRVTEFDPKTNQESMRKFLIKEKKEKLIINDKATIVILDDGCKGVAKCCPEDKFDRTKGIKIAYLRAKIKSLQKELNELVK